MAAKKKKASKKSTASEEYVADIEATIKKLEFARLAALKLLKAPVPRFSMNGKRPSVDEAIVILERAVD